MKRIKNILLILAIITGISFPILTPSVGAVDPLQESCEGADADNLICKAINDETDTVPNLIKTIVNILTYIIGTLSVIMIIVGGLMYTTSAGNADSIKKAKSTILYAVIGLVVALLSYAIVNFVLTNL